MIPKRTLSDEEKEKHLKELFEYIKAVPDIPYNVREKEYKSKCPCGGILTAGRLKYNGHLRCYCDKCDFKLIK